MAQSKKKKNLKQADLDDDLSTVIGAPSVDEDGGAKKMFDAPASFYGTVLHKGRWIACKALVNVQGQVEEFRQYYHSEVEEEFAADTLRKVLVQDRKVRF